MSLVPKAKIEEPRDNIGEATYYKDTPQRLQTAPETDKDFHWHQPTIVDQTLRGARANNMGVHVAEPRGEWRGGQPYHPEFWVFLDEFDNTSTLDMALIDNEVV